MLGDSFVPSALDQALLSARSLKPYEVVQVMKTWSNSWATSHRFHEKTRLPCLFGCSGGLDSMQHYAFCEFIASICTSQPGDSQCFCCSLLGLEDPTPINLKGVAAMFYAYHSVSLHPSVRFLFNSGPLQQIPDSSFEQFQQFFAGSFAAAMWLAN